MKHVAEAQRVLHDEAQALSLLADGLGTDFEKAVDCLLNIPGRIAVTGMGKSGHVARKIAATLASTGSPAYFIHPAEASHGDLGMMTERDAVIAISNSGNTAELNDIILYACQNRLPLIGITKNADSFLGKHCDYLLLQPQTHEACPLDCAPTTSTTVQIALGDALAMCLLTARCFRKEDFHKYHPGGSLGKKLLLVKDIMHTGDALPLVKRGTLIREALFVMTKKGFGCVGIVDEDNRLVGIITDGDIRRHLSETLLYRTVDEIMTKEPVNLHKDMLREKALAILAEKKIGEAFVVKDGEVVGIMSKLRTEA